MRVLTLKEWRAERLMTQRELTRRAGLGFHKTVHMIESGETKRAQPTTIKKICRVLGVQPGQVIEFAAITAERTGSPPSAIRRETGVPEYYVVTKRPYLAVRMWLVRGAENAEQAAALAQNVETRTPDSWEHMEASECVLGEVREAKKGDEFTATVIDADGE